jgi:hypothetical protein
VDDHSAGSDGERVRDEEIIDEEIISPTSYVTCFLCKVMNNDNNVSEVEECRTSGIKRWRTILPPLPCHVVRGFLFWFI